MIDIVQFQTQLLSFSLIVVHFKINIDHSLICYFQKVDVMKRQITAFSLFMCKQVVADETFFMEKVLLTSD